MVAIRKLQPTVKIRKLKDPLSKERRDQLPRGILVVERRLKDFPPPTPLETPCRLWQGSVDPDGYGRRKFKVGLGSGPNEGWRTISMHRWVVETVRGYKLGPKQVVMHLCDNRLCYRFDHLRVGTTQENTADMVRKGRNVKPPVHHYHGASNPNARLSEGNIAWVRELSAQGHYQKTIAEMTGISKSHVQRILAGQSWWHIHYPNTKGPPDEFRRGGGRGAVELGRGSGSEPSGVGEGEGFGAGGPVEDDQDGG